MLLSPRPFPGQGWPCREGNPLLPLQREAGELGTERDEPAHGGHTGLPSPRHGAVRLEIAWHSTEGAAASGQTSLCNGGSCGIAQEEQTQALHLGGCRAPHAPFSSRGYKAEHRAGRQGNRGSCSL